MLFFKEKLVKDACKISLALALCFFLTTQTYAQEKNCGTFSFQGTVKIVDKKMNLFINEKTLSQYTFELSTKQVVQMAPYLEKTVKGKLEITKISSPFYIKDFIILETDRGTINPLVPTENSYLKSVAPKVCEN